MDPKIYSIAFSLKLWERPPQTEGGKPSYYAVWQERVPGKRTATRKNSLHTADKKTAVRRIRRFARELERGQVERLPAVPGQNTRLDLFAKDYLAHKSVDVTPATLALDKEALDKAIAIWGPAKNLGALSQRDLDFFRVELSKWPHPRPGGEECKTLTKRTVNKHIGHVNTALAQAWAWKLTPKAFKIKKLKIQEQPARFLTMDQIQSIMDHAPSPEYRLYMNLSLLTGLRNGEVLRLVWSDVDNPRGYLRIDPKQKNKVESRIPINAEARQVLETLAEMQG